MIHEKKNSHDPLVKYRNFIGSALSKRPSGKKRNTSIFTEITFWEIFDTPNISVAKLIAKSYNRRQVGTL
jgi:hypothetical protein